MFTKLKAITVMTIMLLIVSFNAWAATAVTIKVTLGPSFIEGDTTTIDLLVPNRPMQAAPLKIGDIVFFEALGHPLSMGEGIITNIYDTQDKTIKEAILLERILP